MDLFDLFVSYHGADVELVEVVQRQLEGRGIRVFRDRDCLTAGLPWPEQIEEALRCVRAVAVFIGSSLGSWQRRELYFALDRQTREQLDGRVFPVIPVLLPNADTTPAFIFQNTWVDLREGVTAPHGLDALEAAVRGATGTAEPMLQVESLTGAGPYRGLSAFREEDAAFFVGREAFAERLRQAVLRAPLVAVVGSSGCGKSSIVHAGLIPLLRREKPPARTWDIVSWALSENS